MLDGRIIGETDETSFPQRRRRGPTRVFEGQRANWSRGAPLARLDVMRDADSGRGGHHAE